MLSLSERKSLVGQVRIIYQLPEGSSQLNSHSGLIRTDMLLSWHVRICQDRQKF